VPGQVRGPRGGREGFAQHFLRSSRLAAEIAHSAHLSPGDRVVEFGAGTGVLTSALAACARQVLAVEIDEALVDELARRFSTTPAVTVIHGDALEVPLPATPYRVVANVPFNRTTAILRRLLETPRSALVRADLIVQWDVARKRARTSPGPPIDLLGATWGPWWTFERGRRLPATLFRPSPTVDAGILIVTRRSDELLAPSEHRPFGAFVRRGFSESRLRPLLTQLLTKQNAARLEASLGYLPTTAPRDLNVHEWVELYRGCQPR
jgi:23S rRNA (adenine-N6)-dimethyltransferase